MLRSAWFAAASSRTDRAMRVASAPAARGASRASPMRAHERRARLATLDPIGLIAPARDRRCRRSRMHKPIACDRRSTRMRRASRGDDTLRTRMHRHAAPVTRAIRMAPTRSHARCVVDGSIVCECRDFFPIITGKNPDASRIKLRFYGWKTQVSVWLSASHAASACSETGAVMCHGSGNAQRRVRCDGAFARSDVRDDDRETASRAAICVRLLAVGPLPALLIARTNPSNTHDAWSQAAAKRLCNTASRSTQPEGS